MVTCVHMCTHENRIQVTCMCNYGWVWLHVCMCVHMRTGYRLPAYAIMDGCGYMFHFYFLRFNVITLCENLILLCLKDLVMI